MAKIVGGFADSLLTSVVRAWDAWGELDATQEGTGGAGRNRKPKKRRIIVAPASTYSLSVPESLSSFRPEPPTQIQPTKVPTGDGGPSPASSGPERLRSK
jgi:hypothetical protein